MGVPGQQTVGLPGSTLGLTCRMLFLFSPVIEEGGVKMKLTVIDTPGFGDQINNENWYVSASADFFPKYSARRTQCTSIPIEAYLHPPGKEVGSPRRMLPLLTIHGKPPMGRPRENWQNWPLSGGGRIECEMGVRGLGPLGGCRLCFPYPSAGSPLRNTSMSSMRSS